MCSEDIQQAMLVCLQNIENSLNSDEYETSDPFTIGGATGLYQLSSPWNSECEWGVASALALGTFGFVLGMPTEVSVPASAGPTTLFTGKGVLNSIEVTTAGTVALTFQDGAGSILDTVPAAAPVGTLRLPGEAFNTSLVVNNLTTTGVVTVTYTPLGVQASNAIFAIGSKNPGIRVPVAGDTYGSTLTTGRDASNPPEMYMGGLTAQAPFVTYDVVYMPLPSPATIYLAISAPASTAVFVTIICRRKLTRYIPEKPRQKPHTHTVVSRAALRRMPAESTQVAGYEAQYPEQGGQPYKHVLIPSGDQDTAVAKRGIFPLGGGNGNGRRR